MRLKAIFLAVGLVLAPASAHAAPIGTFEWTYDALFGTGSVFGITNQSDDAFLDVFVDLYAPSDTVAFQSMSLGMVGAGSSSQSIDDLSLLLVPDDIVRATLRLTYLGSEVTATLLASSLQGDATFLLQGATDILGEELPGTQPVPEPSTLFLVGSALLTAVALRGRRNWTTKPHAYSGVAPRD